MKRAFLWAILAIGVWGCVPQASNPCIDDYYKVYEATNNRDDAATAYWECVEGRR